ncbi:15653_t:CDS:1 [Acaulospora morrowiae]|uniref:15653_t:CDS:1 n=1 Tax=Acaulospora morrowiae TaxID=94023 RepID=A0A9N9CBY6_9GLOM|nr:15653_t:CDS:1 [Acaulospora morrowiae]
MAENLRDEKKGQPKTPEQTFPIMSKLISPHLLSLLTIFPYQWLNSKTKFNEKQLPSRKDFNSDLDGYNCCEHGCENKECEHEKIYTISQKDYGFAWIVWVETDPPEDSETSSLATYTPTSHMDMTKLETLILYIKISLTRI